MIMIKVVLNKLAKEQALVKDKLIKKHKMLEIKFNFKNKYQEIKINKKIKTITLVTNSRKTFKCKLIFREICFQSNKKIHKIMNQIKGSNNSWTKKWVKLEMNNDNKI